MEQDKEQLIDLFTDCIKKRRFVSDINDKVESQLQQMEYSFNNNTLYKPKVFYQYMQLGLLPKNIRPDLLLFYNTGESGVVEIINHQNQLKSLLNEKYINPEDNFYKYLGDYRYILCSNDVNIDAVPDNWGILKIDMVEKKKHPHIILTKPAIWVKKNCYVEAQLLIRNLCISKDRLSKIHKISCMGE